MAGYSATGFGRLISDSGSEISVGLALLVTRECIVDGFAQSDSRLGDVAAAVRLVEQVC